MLIVCSCAEGMAILLMRMLYLIAKAAGNTQGSEAQSVERQFDFPAQTSAGRSTASGIPTASTKPEGRRAGELSRPRDRVATCQCACAEQARHLGAGQHPDKLLALTLDSAVATEDMIACRAGAVLLVYRG